MRDIAAAYSVAHLINPRVRLAMRILENEQTPLAATADIAARTRLSLFYFTRLFEEQVGLSPQDYGRGILMMHAASRLRYSSEPIAIVGSDIGYAAGSRRAHVWR